MARLIDADKRIAEIKKVYCDGCDNCGVKCCACWVDDAMCLIDDAPTVDAVEVVRCKDCQHYTTTDFDGDIMCGCTLYSALLDITPDSFCSYGERKEGADRLEETNG